MHAGYVQPGPCRRFRVFALEHHLRQPGIESLYLLRSVFSSPCPPFHREEVL